jgi:hypothetical protein
MKHSLSILLLLCLCICLPESLFAAVAPSSVTGGGGEGTGKMIFLTIESFMRPFLLSSYDALGNDLLGFFGLLIIVIVSVGGCLIAINVGLTPWIILKFVLSVMVIKLLLEVNAFEFWLYEPIMDVFYNLPAFILRTAAKGGGDAPLSITEGFDHIGNVVDKMVAVSDVIRSQQGMLGDIWVAIQSMVLRGVYYLVYVAYTFHLIMALCAIHLLLMFLPLVLVLAVIPRMRFMLSGLFQGIIKYTLTAAFAAAAMALVVGICSSLIEGADAAIKEGTVPEALFSQAIIIGIISFLLINRCTELAALLSNTMSIGFGSTVTGGATTAMALSRTNIARLGAGAVGGAKGATYKPLGELLQGNRSAAAGHIAGRGIRSAAGSAFSAAGSEFRSIFHKFGRNPK